MTAPQCCHHNAWQLDYLITLKIGHHCGVHHRTHTMRVYQSSLINVQVSKQLSSSAAVLKAGPPPVEAIALLTAVDLEKPVCIRLEETETIWLLHLPGGCINADTDEGKAVETANSKYGPAAAILNAATAWGSLVLYLPFPCVRCAHSLTQQPYIAFVCC